MLRHARVCACKLCAHCIVSNETAPSGAEIKFDAPKNSHNTYISIEMYTYSKNTVNVTYFNYLIEGLNKTIIMTQKLPLI